MAAFSSVGCSVTLLKACQFQTQTPSWGLTEVELPTLSVGCRLLHLLTLLLTLWGECSHIYLCVWCDSASGSDNLFHSNNHCSLDEYLQRLYSIQISLALRYTVGCYIKSVCAMLSFTMQAALKNHKMPHHYVYWIAVCLSSHKDIYAQK